MQRLGLLVFLLCARAGFPAPALRPRETGDGSGNEGLRSDDDDECLLQLDNCDINANCTNTEGSFHCFCYTGYDGNGTSCFDLNECTKRAHDCDENAVCSNTVGSFECTCNDGTAGDGRVCANIDECGEELDDCNVDGACSDTVGSYSCACNAGYAGNGVERCENVNECTEITCDAQRLFVNCQNGSTFFQTKNSTVPDACNTSEVCTPMHTCLEEGSYCIDTLGSFFCECATGYSRPKPTEECTNINECRDRNNNCSPWAVCSDTAGSFTCQCKPGYGGNGINCTNEDECRNPNANSCHTLAECTDSVGSFACACKEEYEGDGVTSCRYSPPPGSPVTVVTVFFTAVIPVDRVKIYTNLTLQSVYRHAVAAAAAADVSLVHIIFADAPGPPESLAVAGRREGEDEVVLTSAVETQMVIARKPLVDVGDHFGTNLKKRLGAQGLELLSLSSLSVQYHGSGGNSSLPRSCSTKVEIVVGASSGSAAGFALFLVFAYYVLKYRIKSQERMGAAPIATDIEAPPAAKAELGYGPKITKQSSVTKKPADNVAADSQITALTSLDKKPEAAGGGGGNGAGGGRGSEGGGARGEGGGDEALARELQEVFGGREFQSLFGADGFRDGAQPASAEVEATAKRDTGVEGEGRGREARREGEGKGRRTRSDVSVEYARARAREKGRQGLEGGGKEGQPGKDRVQQRRRSASAREGAGEKEEGGGRQVQAARESPLRGKERGKDGVRGSASKEGAGNRGGQGGDERKRGASGEGGRSGDAKKKAPGFGREGNVDEGEGGRDPGKLGDRGRDGQGAKNRDEAGRERKRDGRKASVPREGKGEDGRDGNRDGRRERRPVPVAQVAALRTCSS